MLTVPRSSLSVEEIEDHRPRPSRVRTGTEELSVVKEPSGLA
jgi:hypothetical protein